MSAVNLFHFFTRDNNWYYASDVANVSANSITWAAAAIDIKNSTGERGGEFTVTAPNSIEPFSLYRSATLGTVLKVNIYDTDGTTLKRFGTARQVKLDKNENLTRSIVFSREGIAENQTLLKFKFSRNCNHTVYDSGCGVNPSSFQTTVPESAVSGRDISHANIGAQADGYWLRGWVLNGNEIRTILTHSGNDITINAPFVENTNGTFTVRRGCDGQFSTCDNVFSNSANFFGFPNIPERDPHQGV